ncbi:hypothetical protein BT93_L1348 [Corymbia citriodora subsp. variegata]|uniref:RRM domain-containing protein n=1 Tax=Corymbia citriodora subsp. variegata TaxID=360336 RepID=A0A8T0CE94_CORYI|nr:hypothetical protein BT93_L1348 [Corymbia citriodora subsp. variegata]
MAFVEFEDVSYATKALHELYGVCLSNSTKGGIRLSFSKNPLGVRTGQMAGMGPGSPMGSPAHANGYNGGMGAPPGFSTASGPPPGLGMPGLRGQTSYNQSAVHDGNSRFSHGFSPAGAGFNSSRQQSNSASYGNAQYDGDYGSSAFSGQAMTGMYQHSQTNGMYNDYSGSNGGYHQGFADNNNYDDSTMDSMSNHQGYQSFGMTSRR